MSYLNEKNKRLKRIKISQPIQEEKEKNNWFLKLFVDLFFGFVSAGIEILATSLLGPVGGMLVGVVGDISTNMLADLVNGDNPLSKENLIFNITLTAFTIPGRIKGISRINKNKVNIIGHVDDNDQYKHLGKELNNIDLNDVDAIGKAQRKYQQILDKYDDIDLTKIIPEQEFINKATSQVKHKKILNNYSKSLRIFNKALNLTDPAFVINELINFVTKPLKRKINKGIKGFIKTINSKFFKQAKKTVNRTIIPLNHIEAEWIKGIKLIAIPHSINFFHVIVFFDKKLTNKKQPVYLFNKSWTNIKKFIDSPSSGQYYINNICWGWKIGSFLRNNNHFNHLSKLVVFSSMYSKTFNISIRTINTIVKTTEKLLNIEETISKWTNKDSYIQGISQGLFSGIKGAGLIKPVIRTIQTKDNTFLVRYGSRLVKKNINKKMKITIKKTTNKLRNRRLKKW